MRLHGGAEVDGDDGTGGDDVFGVTAFAATGDTLPPAAASGTAAGLSDTMYDLDDDEHGDVVDVAAPAPPPMAALSSPGFPPMPPDAIRAQLATLATQVAGLQAMLARTA